MVGWWLRCSAVVQLTCANDAVCCTCAGVAMLPVLPNLHNSLQLAMVGSREPVTGSRWAPGPASLQRISNPHQRQAPTAFSAPGCLQGSKPAAQRRPGRRRHPRRGGRASFALGVTTTSRDPKTNPPRLPNNSPPLPKPKKNSPRVCPGFIAVVGVLLRVVAAAGGSSWVDSLWLPVERSEWL